MSNQVLLSIIAAAALVFQIQTGWNAVPSVGLQAGIPTESLCTGVDLNVGCVPVELSQKPVRGLGIKSDPS
jgi:hypothetical protein